MFKFLLAGGAIFLVLGIFFYVIAGPHNSGYRLKALDFISKYQSTPGAVLIDVRTPGEYAEGHLESSININFHDSAGFAAAIAKLDKNKPYFIYCRSGNRSAHAAAQMRAAGIREVYDLNGGIASNGGKLTLVVDSSTHSQ